VQAINKVRARVVGRRGKPGTKRKKKKRDPIVEAKWKKYKETGDKALRNELLEYYYPLVKRTAERVYQKLPHNIDLDDLVSSGVFGLKDAIEGFDLARGVKFETYCTTRIRGAILDELRSVDWVPRLVRSKATELDRALRTLEVELGRNPTDREVAELLDLSTDDFAKLVKDSKAVTMTSLSEQWPQQDDDQNQLRKIDVLQDRKQVRPGDLLQRKDVLELVTRSLSMKERLILLLYYFEGLTMREIGLTLDLSESRVCQLHTRIMDRLREQLGRVRIDLIP
jgi:RNA polymerase sigma factor for flagellar operon FliA